MKSYQLMTLTICHNNGDTVWFCAGRKRIQLPWVHGGTCRGSSKGCIYPVEGKQKCQVGSGRCLHLWLQLLWKMEIRTLRWLREGWVITYLVVSHQQAGLSTPAHQLEGPLHICMLLDVCGSVCVCVHICVGGMLQKCWWQVSTV